MAFRIVRNDITRMETQAIVNTANDHMTVGSGCDRAVYEAAGYDELLAYRKEKIGFVPEGDAFITPGFGLKAEYIIHAVSPLYIDGEHGEEEKLRSCYRRSLAIAKEHGIRSISFPLIATGSFGYPKEEGMRIAADEINSFLLTHDIDVYLVVFGKKATRMGKSLYADLESYIDENYVEERYVREYGTPEYRRRERTSRRRSELLSSAEKVPAGGYDASVTRLEKGLSERMEHISDTFSEYLLYLINRKGMENAEVYKRAIIDKKVFSKIKNNPDYHPQKLTALCLCVGAKLNIDETRDLLARAGYALSPSDKTDIIFSYFIENRIYDMIELDIQLEEHGLPCIIN